MASSTSFLRTSSCLLRSVTSINRPILMSHTKSLSSLTKMTASPLPSMVPRLVSCRTMATKGDQELSKFLVEEIQTEKKNQRGLPRLDGWSVATEGSEVTLTKEVAGGEKVMITLNVNHTVDSAQPDDGTEEVPEGQEEGMDDVFSIDEVTMFEGDSHSDACYAVAGDILDGYLYDLLMTMLEERGVDNNFAERLSEWCSTYEHNKYLGLLEDMERWTKL